MSSFAQPFHLVYLNHDYSESLHPVRSARDVVITLATQMGVGIDPLKGVTADFWAAIDQAYQGNWKGASAFRVEGLSAQDLSPIDNPQLSATELNMAVINAPLSQNPKDPVYAVLMNHGFQETAAILADKKQVIAKLIEVLGLGSEDIDDDADFEDAVYEAYNSKGWKGLLVAEINAQTLEHRVISPEDLGFEMSDLGQIASRPGL